jgi:hypothetical protein
LFQLFATGVIDTGGKFIADVVDTLTPMSTTPVVPVAKFGDGILVDTGGAP